MFIIYITILLNPRLHAEALRQTGSLLKRERALPLPTSGEGDRG